MIEGNKTLIVGLGEIGKSLKNVLDEEYTCYSYDISDSDERKEFLLEQGPYIIMHICFPYSATFCNDVLQYQLKYQPNYTIIHSTCPVGTNKKLGSISSPVVGLHPHLEESLKTFTKFLGGSRASEVADYFRRAGIKVHLEDSSEMTELLKIQSTTLYALQIEFYKDMKRQCSNIGGDYNSWLLWLDNYNKGYEKLGYAEYKKPLLEPIMKKQGGHCTLPNLKLIDTKFTKFLQGIT